MLWSHSKVSADFLDCFVFQRNALILQRMQFCVSLRSSHFTHCLHDKWTSDLGVACWCADMPIWAAIVRTFWCSCARCQG